MKNVEISKFAEKVYGFTKKIPRGKVVTYILNKLRFAKNVIEPACAGRPASQKLQRGEYYPQISPFEKSHVLRFEGHFNSIFSNKVRFLNKFRNMKLFGYRQIAKVLGNIKAFRAVGNALHKNPFAPDVPCHRVVNNKGFLAEKFGSGGAKAQQKLLESERIIFDISGRVNLKKYQYFFKE